MCSLVSQEQFLGRKGNHGKLRGATGFQHSDQRGDEPQALFSSPPLATALGWGFRGCTGKPRAHCCPEVDTLERGLCLCACLCACVCTCACTLETLPGNSCIPGCGSTARRVPRGTLSAWAQIRTWGHTASDSIHLTSRNEAWGSPGRRNAGYSPRSPATSQHLGGIHCELRSRGFPVPERQTGNNKNPGGDNALPAGSSLFAGHSLRTYFPVPRERRVLLSRQGLGEPQRGSNVAFLMAPVPCPLSNQGLLLNSLRTLTSFPASISSSGAEAAQRAGSLQQSMSG